ALKKQYQINEVDPYIVASRFATYTPFFNLNYFALAAKEYQRLSRLWRARPDKRQVLGIVPDAMLAHLIRPTGCLIR
ncbi:hypothetical protein E2K61_20395, partial [Escherichia coli]